MINPLARSPLIFAAVSGWMGATPLAWGQSSTPLPPLPPTLAPAVDASPARSPSEAGTDQSPAENEPSAVPNFPVDGGLARNTLEEASRPQAAPANQSARRARSAAQEVVRRRERRRLRQRLAAEEQQGKQKILVQNDAHAGAARRNPVASFVYWWNGWVIRTFHTKVGTVMLKTVGAKT